MVPNCEISPSYVENGPNHFVSVFEQPQQNNANHLCKSEEHLGRALRWSNPLTTQSTKSSLTLATFQTNRAKKGRRTLWRIKRKHTTFIQLTCVQQENKNHHLFCNIKSNKNDHSILCSSKKKNKFIDVMGPIALTIDEIGLSVKDPALIAASAVNKIGLDVKVYKH